MQATIQIPGYEQFEHLATGGMATVYRARKMSIDKPVAIKVLFSHLAADDTYLRQFKHEAQAAARVQHDNIVNVVDYGVSESQHFIVMELYDGYTLEELLSKHRTMPADAFFAVMLGVCYGLEAAHSEDLIHRDIKPANIILTHRGAVKIADFGLARDIGALKRSSPDGKVVGTPAYMSPEQTRGDDLGPQTDIFSLGVVAHEMISGQRPFDGNSYPEVLDAIQSQAAPALSTSGFPRSLWGVVNRMMAKSPADRYEDISSIILDLEACMDEAAIKPSPRTLSEFCGGSGPSASGAATSRAKVGGAAEVAPAPDAQYRVFLEDIDRLQESPETFALKVSMKIKMPVPRVNALLRRMPTEFAGHLPHQKAEKLARVLTGLGGQVRVESYRSAPPRKPDTKSPAPAPESPKPKSRSNTPSKPRKKTQTVTCSSCGWEEDADARFCSVCNHAFNKTETLSVESLQGKQDLLNDLSPETLENESPRLLEYLKQPVGSNAGAKIAAGAAVVIVLLAVVLTIILSL